MSSVFHREFMAQPADDLVDAKRAFAASRSDLEACENANCKCARCECGKACACDVPDGKTCDPCVAFKRDNSERAARAAT